MSEKRQGRDRPVTPPRLPDSTAMERYTGDGLYDHETYVQLRVQERSLGGPPVEGLTFRQCTFSRAGLVQLQWELLRLLDCRLRACDLANSEWYRGVLQRVIFDDCRLLGLRVNEGRFQDLRFQDCAMQGVQFRFAAFDRVQFINCNLTEADFQEADLSGVRFVNCDLGQASVLGANLEESDLRGTRLAGLKAGGKELKGAIIEPSQAIELAPLLGVRIAWEDPFEDTGGGS